MQHSELLLIARRGELCLAPMVRVGGLPFRALCLQYGADKVWSEEIIAQRISRCVRIENKELGTVDFVYQQEKSGHKEDVVVFQTDPVLERGKCIFQMGVGSASDALAAALVVHRDVAGIDINMGCPMKFSIQGGMGAALLSRPAIAAEIVKILSDNLDIPVTVKIRLFDTTEQTIDFMQLLERSGASGITVHFRKRGTRTRDPADWSGVEKIIAAVNIPVYANGDFYEPADICRIINMGCSGVLLARPLLMNPSLLRFRDVHDVVGDYYSCRLDRFLSLRDTIRDYVKLCAKYELPYQLAKYTIMEMMNSGRHTKIFMGKMKEIGLDSGRLSEFEEVQSSGCLASLLGTFSVSRGGDDSSVLAVGASGGTSSSTVVLCAPEAPGGWGIVAVNEAEDEAVISCTSDVLNADQTGKGEITTSTAVLDGVYSAEGIGECPDNRATKRQKCDN